MKHSARVTIALTLLALTGACSRPEPSDGGEPPQSAEPISTISPPAIEKPAPELSNVPAPVASEVGTPPGSMVVYGCEDGSSVTVTYDEFSALVKLSTGATTLSRAESLSGGGDEAYLGEELSLYRNGNLVQLQVAGKTRACTRTSS